MSMRKTVLFLTLATCGFLFMNIPKHKRHKPLPFNEPKLSNNTVINTSSQYSAMVLPYHGYDMKQYKDFWSDGANSGQLSIAVGGGLGNTMFQYASALALAKANNKIFVVGSYFFLSILYRNFLTSSLAPDVAQPANDIWEDEGYWGKWQSRYYFLGSGNFLIHSLLQSWKYFDPIKDVIRENFQFRRNLQAIARSKIKLMFRDIAPRKVVVAVHIRRGDMVPANQNDQDPNKENIFSVASCSYFRNAMSYFTDAYGSKDTLFVVCSEGYDWIERCFSSQNMINSLNKTRVFSNQTTQGNNGPEPREFNYIFCPRDSHGQIDMAIMVLTAQHTIMSVGTFSWWTAWLINGTTVYYDRWPSGLLKAGINRDDYFMPHWIGMH